MKPVEFATNMMKVPEKKLPSPSPVVRACRIVRSMRLLIRPEQINIAMRLKPKDMKAEVFTWASFVQLTTTALLMRDIITFIQPVIICNTTLKKKQKLFQVQIQPLLTQEVWLKELVTAVA